MSDHICTDKDLDILFRKARSVKSFQRKMVTETLIHALYDLLRWGPTSFNCSPARFVFVQNKDAREKLATCVMDSNKQKVLSAPLTVIVGYDKNFYEKLPYLFKAAPYAKDIFNKDQELSEETAFRNSSLQGGYLMIAARSLGLDCCPMSGFDKVAVNKNFFNNKNVVANFICGIGYGDRTGLAGRDERLAFDQACEII